MRIMDLLKIQSIQLNGSALNKNDVIEKLTSLMNNTGSLSNPEVYKKCVLAREEESTTGIGEGIAIPHAKSDSVKTPSLCAMVLPDGVDYDALDGKPVHLLFLIAAPDTDDNVHLDVLSRLSVLLMDDTFTHNLKNAKTPDEFLGIINHAENEKFSNEKRSNSNRTSEAHYQLVGVTACPTGIAHTYMAAESLENKAKEMGITIKVETNGSGGVKNILTKKEIEEAHCVIIAADKNVEMARFNGKHILNAAVSDAIHKPEKLIEKAIDQQTGIYHHDENEGASAEENTEGIGRTIYKHLMNGVSHMLPFVIGGGILIALAFLFDQYDINPANFGKNTPFAAFLKTIGEAAFGFMLPILSGYIAMSIADRPGLAVGFVGGAVASAGYTFTNVMDYGNANPVSSGFIGALLAGFIGGYLVLGLRKLFHKLPKSLEGIKPMLIYPVLGILLMGALMTFINPAVAAINTAMNNGLSSMGGTSKILLGAVLGGMMSIDMGGPFNKAAYVFGTAGLVNGEFEIMAAVMAGGMVPPLVIALCATFFKNRFNKKDRPSAYINYIMGLSFISEGAIPFAAADPFRVIPSCIVGSAVAGALSMLFRCGLRAPHGGIFVIPTVSNPFGYLAAILIGSIIGGIILAILKKPIKQR